MNYFKELPTWAKGVVAVLVAGTTAFVGWRIYKTLKLLKESENTRANVKQSAKELDAILGTETPSYEESTYGGWANQIENLLKGCDFNKNDIAILTIIKRLLNNADYLKLVRAFGSRTITGCGFVADYSADLPTVLKKEMTEWSLGLANSWLAKTDSQIGKKPIKYSI